MPELTWDGKYDKEGRRIPPLRVSLPFQTVETVNESPRDRQRSLDLFSAGILRGATDWFGAIRNTSYPPFSTSLPERWT